MDTSGMPQKNPTLEQLEQLRENFHSQYRMQYLNNILTQNRILFQHLTSQSYQDVNKTQEQKEKNEVPRLQKNYASKLKDKDQLEEWIYLASQQMLIAEKQSDIQVCCIERLLSKSFRFDPQYIHLLLILQQLTVGEIDKQVLTYYAQLFIRYPNLLTIVVTLENWIKKYPKLSKDFEEICQQSIPDIDGTLVQFVCNKENHQNYKGRLEMLRVLIQCVGNKELLQALFLLEISEFMLVCLEPFNKEVYNIILCLLENVHFNQFKHIEKIITKLKKKLKQSKIECLNEALLCYQEQNKNKEKENLPLEKTGK